MVIVKEDKNRESLQPPHPPKHPEPVSPNADRETSRGGSLRAGWGGRWNKEGQVSGCLGWSI